MSLSGLSPENAWLISDDARIVDGVVTITGEALNTILNNLRAEGARLEPTEDQLRAGAGELARLAEHPDDLDIARCVYLAVRDGDRQKGSAERDGGAGVPESGEPS